MDAHWYRKEFGLTIQRLRHGRSLSQREFAAMAGTNQAYLSKIENGETNVGIDLIFRIGEAFGVPINELFV